MIQQDNMQLLNKIALDTEILDPEEVIMVLYVSAVCMNNQPAFDHLVKKNRSFRQKPDWHVILSQFNIFEKLQRRIPYGAERSQLDVIALRIALERDI